jgi:transposase
MTAVTGTEIFTDEAWAVWEPLIEEVRPRGKTPPKELRRTLSAIFWRHQNGAKWRSIPSELGPWWLAAQLFIRWSKHGVWERLLEVAQQHDLALGMSFIDGSRRCSATAAARRITDAPRGTNIRAHHKAAGAEKRGSTARSATCARRLAALAAAMAPRPA